MSAAVSCRSPGLAAIDGAAVADTAAIEALASAMMLRAASGENHATAAAAPPATTSAMRNLEPTETSLLCRGSGRNSCGSGSPSGSARNSGTAWSNL